MGFLSVGAVDLASDAGADFVDEPAESPAACAIASSNPPEGFDEASDEAVFDGGVAAALSASTSMINGLDGARLREPVPAARPPDDVRLRVDPDFAPEPAATLRSAIVKHR